MKATNLNKGYEQHRKYSKLFIFIYCLLFLLGIKTLFHGFPDIERFFAEWMDERLTLKIIMKFGTLNFAPTEIWHPPLYHYLTFIPIAIFFLMGKTIGFFHDKVDFIRFYFNNTHYFFFIGRTMSYIFYWLAAIAIYRIVRLFYDRVSAHITVCAYLLMPRFIFDFSTTRPETLLFLNTSIFFYFFLKYYLNNREIKYLFMSAFFLGICTATKYNAIYLGSIFIPLFAIQLKDSVIYDKNYKGLVILYLKSGFFIFLGFFICDPFFIIQFSKYFHNLMIYTTEMKYYWKDGYSGFLRPRHLIELTSFMYINFFGFLILLFGLWSLFKKDKKLFIIVSFAILVYEIYFGIYLKSYSPLRYLNPLIPIAILIFSTGVDFIIKHKKKFVLILIIFLGVLFYNYFDIWQGLSLGPTHIQKARAFIEKNTPEFTTICITSNEYIPQLSMTRETYHYLVKTAPVYKYIPGHELTYKDIDREENYDNIFRELRIESLMKKPQYNLIRWDDGIKTENDAISFLKKNRIEYIISTGAYTIRGKDLENTKIAFLVKKFSPRNRRIYGTVYGDVGLFLYRVNKEVLR